MKLQQTFNCTKFLNGQYPFYQQASLIKRERSCMYSYVKVLSCENANKKEKKIELCQYIWCDFEEKPSKFIFDVSAVQITHVKVNQILKRSPKNKLLIYFPIFLFQMKSMIRVVCWQKII